MGKNFILIGVLLAGCNGPVYLGMNRALETRVPTGMQMGYQSDTDLYVLPVRQPTQTEQMNLDQTQQALALPMPVPWVQIEDFDVEIEYSLKNLDPTENEGFVTLVGGNEFGDYNPARSTSTRWPT
jgi:hypothetical protein